MNIKLYKNQSRYSKKALFGKGKRNDFAHFIEKEKGNIIKILPLYSQFRK